MEQRTSARLAGKAAAVAVSPERTAATVKRESISSFSSSSNKRQRSVSPSTDAATASHSNNDETNSHNDDAADAATDEMPWGSSWWDKLPAEIRIMIINHNSPLHNFLNGRIGTKKQLESSYVVRPTILAIWVDAFKSDWQGNLDLLPTVKLSVKDGLCEVHTRSMYERLCRRFPGRQWHFSGKEIERNLQGVGFFKGFGYNVDNSLIHIPARHGWFDLLDYEYPVAMGWFAIKYGHPALFRHLTSTLKVVKKTQFKKFGNEVVMDIAAAGGSLEIVQMLPKLGRQWCTTKAMDEAAAGGHFDVMQWLHANRHEGCMSLALENAISRDDLHVVQWLVKHYSCNSKNALIRAAVRGNVDIFALVASRSYYVDLQDPMLWAADSGRLEVIKWIHTHQPEAYTVKVFQRAMRFGHDNIVRFLLGSGYKLRPHQYEFTRSNAIIKMLADSLALEHAQGQLGET